MSNGSGLFSDQQAVVPHLSKGELKDLRDDVSRALSPLAAMTVDEFTNPATGAVADLKAATACTVAVQTISSFLAGGVAALAAYARNVTLTTSGGTPADAPATALVTGTYNGAVQTETINVPQTAATATGLKPFDTVESVIYSAAQGTDALVSIGVGAGLGVTKTPKARAGAVNPLREIAVGALVTTGTLTAAGLYTPAAAPNAARDYALFYEYDPTV